MGGYEVPRYDFREEPSFAHSRRSLAIDDRELDERIWAIQDSIVNDPFEQPWSRPLPANPVLRVAVSDPTEYSRVVIRIIYIVEGFLIKLLHVEER
jgi:hypothetical protein